jgi:hypothetical protein
VNIFAHVKHIPKYEMDLKTRRLGRFIIDLKVNLLLYMSNGQCFQIMVIAPSFVVIWLRNLHNSLLFMCGFKIILNVVVKIVAVLISGNEYY